MRETKTDKLDMKETVALWGPYAAVLAAPAVLAGIAYLLGRKRAQKRLEAVA